MADAAAATELPSFTPLPPLSFSRTDTLEGEVFTQQVSDAYEEIVDWRRNGKVGREFVQELGRMISAYGDGAAFECVAIKAAMIMCSLLLQIPYRSVTSADLMKCLQHLMTVWKQSDMVELLREGCVIQSRLVASKSISHDTERITHQFVNHMFHDNLKSALSLLDAGEHRGAPLNLSEPAYPNDPSQTVFDELVKKERPVHPTAVQPLPSDPTSHPVIFDELNGSAIRSAALRTRGAAGPSGVDAYGWRRLCTSFQRASDDLCNGLASVARCLCTTYVDPDDISALVAC